MKRKIGFSFIAALAMGWTILSEETIDLDAVSRIQQEGFEHSQVMDTLHQLTDVHGPRLTGSPGFREAAEWSRQQLSDWGLEKARLEAWGQFGPGWSLESVRTEMLEPTYTPLIAYPKAWSPGTKGPVIGTPILLDFESAKDLEKYRGRLRGAIVMTRPGRKIVTSFQAQATRLDEQQLETMSREGPREPRRARDPERAKALRQRRQLRKALQQLFKEERPALLIDQSRGEHGTLFVGGSGFRNDTEGTGVPAIVLAAEQYGRIARLSASGVQVRLKIEIETKFHNEDLNGYNVVAEIPGVDPLLRSELVMLGAHLDSWHSSTGATDNAAGCAVAMEAVRILRSIGLEPRRSVRIALWGGEEQGLLGSRGYVANHIADRSTMELKTDHSRVSAYFNLDNGTGKIRGVHLQNNPEVRPIFQAYLEPFHSIGAKTLTIRRSFGTDHLAFDEVGIPGFQFIQDRIDYSTRTHHTNMDSFERVLEEDLKQASVIMAAFVYNTAVRDEMLPRKPLPEPRK